MKRFTDTEKWEDEWFMDLPKDYKLLYQYCIDKCDQVGVIKFNKRLAEFILEFKIDTEDFIKTLGNERVFVMSNGSWWFIKFCDFQYGELKEDSLSKPIISYISKLRKHNLYKGYTKGINTLKEKDKEKDKVKEKDKEKDKEFKQKLIYPFNTENFIKYWELWRGYKKDEFKFTYKTAVSEQAALKKLSEFSNGHEEIAIKIIEQSISNGWSALSKCLMCLCIVSSQEHIKGLTSDLIEVYKHDSVEDIVEALKAGRQGKYGKTYNKLNMIIIHEWMGYQLEAKAILREREHEKVKKDNKDLEQVIDYNKVKERIDNEREGKKDLTDKERDYRNIKFNYQVKNKDGFVHESNPKLKK